jgi:23S rRNA (cytosine1962-C5)-methyltransferase
VGAADYRLFDFGDGRRLEQFGPYVLDRPAPAANGIRPADPEAWDGATASYERASAATPGTWQPEGALPEAWPVRVDGVALELRPTASGQVGLFPEHLAPARVLVAALPALAARLGRAPEVLNLFAYTGLATLLLARAGARVAHVDAARPAVAWARRNAGLSDLGAAPIRWLVEDAAAFTAREVRRGRRYDVIVLDPPTYGHSPRGGGWHIEEGLVGLLRDCAALTGPLPGAILLSAHTAGRPPASLREGIAAAWGPDLAAAAQIRSLDLPRPDGMALPAGACVILVP